VSNGKRRGGGERERAADLMMRKRCFIRTSVCECFDWEQSAVRSAKKEEEVVMMMERERERERERDEDENKW
jgi:hypothetical protein